MSAKTYAEIVRAREAGVLRDLDEATLTEWHQRCSDFRDSVGASSLTGGAFVVGLHPDTDNFQPLFCVRGNALTMEAAVRGLIMSWLAQSHREGTPVTPKDLAEVAAAAWEQWEANKP